MTLSDLYALQADADSAVQILDEAKEFRSVSEIANSRIDAIEAVLEKITSDAPIVLEIKAAISSLKEEQAASNLSSMREALGKLNRLYDNNRQKLRPFETY